MRTVQFIHSFSKLSETFVYDYVTGMRAHNMDTQVITMNRINIEERPYSPVHELNLNVLNPERILRRGLDLIRNKPLETSAWPVYRKKLKMLLKEINPDVLHAHFGPMGVLLSPIAEEMQISLVVTFYGYDISEYARNAYWQEKYRHLARTTAAVSVLSQQMKTEAIDLGFSNRQIHVVHLGTDLDRFPPKSPSYPVRKFLSVGRLSEKKGHLDTLQAFHKTLIKTGHPLQLNIIGEGSEHEVLSRYIRENELKKNIHLIGKRSHQRVIDILYDSDAFILSSKTSSKGDREGTPTVLIEAQAAGLPCISTFHSGIPEIIPEKNYNLLAPEGDIEEIADRIYRLVTASKNDLKHWGERGRKRVETEFNIRSETQKFKNLYESLV